MGCHVSSLRCGPHTPDRLARDPCERTVHEVCPDALATVSRIDANETNRGGVRFAEVHSQVSDRVGVSLDHDDMVSPSLTAPFEPDTV